MDKHEPESGLSFERVVFFSDPVFAIVITLLVLELKVPHIEEHTDSALRHALFNLLPRVAGIRSAHCTPLTRVPIACALAIALSFISIFLAPISFAIIPLLARVLDPTSKKSKIGQTAANEEAAA